MRSQAYASIAVVAALIAGISVTFLVEIDVMPKGKMSHPPSAVGMVPCPVPAAATLAPAHVKDV